MKKRTQHIEGSPRPFRIYHGKHQLRYRYYSSARRAVVGAFIEAKFSAVGTVLEVVDISTGKLIGEYIRRETSVTFRKENSRALKED